MTAKTMLDLGGLAFLEGDPLGLRDLEESLAWQANGPLPDWLEGAEPFEEDSELFSGAEEPAVGQPASKPVEVPVPNSGNVGVAARRHLSTDELNGARLCLLTSVDGKLWAVPFENVTQVARDAAAKAIDLCERLEGKKRHEAGIAVNFENDTALIVDRIVGPRSFDWLPPGGDDPVWVLARTELAEQSVGLLDWQALTTS